MAEFVMPSLGPDMAAGTLVAWKKKPGETVRRGDIIAEVETDKGLIEVEVFTSGVLERIVIPPGEKVPVGTVMAIIREDTRQAGAAQLAPPSTGRPPEDLQAPLAEKPLRPAPGVPLEPPRFRISPAARKLAAELGVDPAAVATTGPGGRITLEDIQRAGARKTAAAPAETDRQARMRQAIAAAMARSKREIPHYYLSTTIDMSRATAWLAEENLKRPVPDRLLYGVLMIKAVALALRQATDLNAVWSEGRAVPSQAIHVGVAISLRQGGLVAPALRHTDRQPLDELMRSFRDLVKRARAGTLRSSELSDSTITVTSLGELGVETVFGIIFPPQVALVGFGKIVERPWVVDGQIVVRPLLTASLSADHRVSDGHRGGLFLEAVNRLLQEPSRL
jgi:pyruvate dehydrogenase E2 component (dihydrolipoamide acetyltransferase)